MQTLQVGGILESSSSPHEDGRSKLDAPLGWEIDKKTRVLILNDANCRRSNMKVHEQQDYIALAYIFAYLFVMSRLL